MAPLPSFTAGLFLLVAIAGSVNAVAEWGQCGGINYNGSKTCDSGLTCSYINDWYSQCLKATTTSTSTRTSSSSSSSTRVTSSSTSSSTPVSSSSSSTPVSSSSSTGVSSTSSTTSSSSSSTPTQTTTASYMILVGGYGNAISSLKFTPSTSSLTYLTQTNIGAQMMTWLHPHPDNSSIIYATQEAYYTNGNIYSLILNTSNGVLTKVNNVSTGPMVSNYGGGCVHVTTINGGTALAAANFNSGSAFIVPLSSDRLGFGSGQVLQFTGSGPLSNQKSAHGHQAIEYGSEVIVADLGSDRVRRLSKNGNTWSEAATISFPAGSGPRHMVAMNNILYTLHQNYNALSQSTLPALGSGGTSQVVANFTIVPSGTNTSGMSAAELLYAPDVTSGASPLLYASNRDDPSGSDAIAIFETTPALKPVAFVRTGLKHVRGMEFVGSNKEYVVVGGMNGGGIKVFKRVSAAQGYLTQVAALSNSLIVQPTGFTWVQL